MYCGKSVIFRQPLSIYRLFLTFPEICTVRRQFASAAKIMSFSGNQIFCHSASCVEMGSIGFAVCVDGNQHPLTVRFPFKDALLIGQNHRTEIAVIQGIRILFRSSQACNPIGQLIPFCWIKAGSENGIAVFLISFLSPFTSIVYTGNAWHTESQRINQRKMGRVA